jgi:Protein of unknown function (DUF1419)
MAAPPMTLSQLIDQLKEGEVVSRPEAESWDAHVERISVAGRIVEIAEDEFGYWLEVLPPHWMRCSQFCFAEGAEAFRFFWRDRHAKRYLCRQLTWEETIQFCELAGLPIPW